MTEVKKFIVTGGAGFIGSALARHIIAETGHSVLVLDKLTYSGSTEALHPVLGNSRFSFIRGDILCRTTLARLFSEYAPDVIVHLAAETHVDRSIDDPSSFIDTNIMGTYNLLQAALEYWQVAPLSKRQSFRFHHVSTDEVFGSITDGGAFTENSPYDPRSPYSASKAASDHLVSAWHHTYGLPILLSNCSNNYGPYQFPEKLIPLMTINALESKPLPIYGNGQNIRDWLYVEDHANALLAVATRGVVGEKYCLGGLCEKTNLSVVESICDILDDLMPRNESRRRLLSFVQDRPGHDLRYAIDPSKIRRELGWQPKETFETGLRKTIEWYIENATWWREIQRSTYSGERLGVRPNKPSRQASL